MNLLRLMLFAAISLCGVESAKSASEALEPRGLSNDNGEILDVGTEAELRSILREVGQNLTPNDCNDWKEDDPRVAAVMNLQVVSQLWIGGKYSQSEGLGVDGLQRTYEIRRLTIGGSPLRGSIEIRLPSAEIDEERACFSKLKDVKIRGSNNEGDGVYEGDMWTMRVSGIKFGVLVKSQGLSGERVETGETQVTLTMSEGLLDMALRKSAEHLWALPGSLGLLILWTFGGRVVRKIQAKCCSRSTSDPRE